MGEVRANAMRNTMNVGWTQCSVRTRAGWIDCIVALQHPGINDTLRVLPVEDWDGTWQGALPAPNVERLPFFHIQDPEVFLAVCFDVI